MEDINIVLIVALIIGVIILFVLIIFIMNSKIGRASCRERV